MAKAHREKELVDGYRAKGSGELAIVAVALFGPTETIERLTAGMTLYGKE
jgi:hypothetical protein